MRKGLIGLLAVAVIILVTVLLSIAKELSGSTFTTIRSSRDGVWRNISDQAKWSNWWPYGRGENAVTTNRPFSYNGYQFKIDGLLYNVVEIAIENKGVVSNGKMVMIPITTDSILIEWQSKL